MENNDMNIQNIIYKAGTASQEQIYLHFMECDADFISSLNEKVNIAAYSKKLFENSITFEAWDDNKLAGLIAAYFNDTKNKAGFITNVSIIKIWKGRGIASELLNACIQYAQQNNYSEIKLEVSDKNKEAIHLYEKFNFHVIKNKNDLRIMKLDLSK